MLNLTNKDYFRQLLQAQYLAKFLSQLKLSTPLPPLPIPDSGPFGVQPQPQPSLSIDARDVLLGDLLISALGEQTPQQNRPLFINQIRKSGVHIEVIKELASQFEEGAKALRTELEAFERNEQR